MSALEDEMTQRNGIVLVVFGLPTINIIPLARTNQTLLSAVPLRRVASHYFISNKSVQPIVRIWMQVGGEEFRLRSRIHNEGT